MTPFPEEPYRPFHILLVEDEPGDVEMIRIAITEGRYPCQITVAEDGIEALSLLQRPSPAPLPLPDLVLLDLNMPRMNGRDVLKAMKADPALARIPVVVLTTSEAERDIAQSYDLGAASYVVKPIDVEQIFHAIHGIEDYWFGIVRSRPPHAG